MIRNFCTALVLTLACAVSASVSAADAGVDKIKTLINDKEVVELIATFPVQDGGRIKPLDTVARFRLLRYHGKQSIRTEGTALADEKKLNAVQWMIVSWFRPDLAKELSVFVVDNSEAITELGLQAKGLRDRYSYNEILPGRTALMQKMQEVRNIDAKDRTPVQRTLAKLSIDFLDYEMMLSHFDFARAPFGELAKDVPAEILEAGKPVPPITELMPKISAYFQAHPEAAAPMANPWLREYYRVMLGAMMSGNEEQTLRIFPPAADADEVWKSPGGVMQASLEGGSVTAAQLGEFAQWARLPALSEAPDAFKKELQDLYNKTLEAANARNEGSRLNMEESYHRQDYFFKSLYWFVAGLLAIALSWVAPRSSWGKWCVRICWATMIIGTIYATVGIVIRCIIMQRPPITTLYETIIFIAATGVILALIAELLTRKGVALLVAALSGAAGMFLSIRYMNMEGTDTMQQLQAVLITNFWLATHVPIINLGYAAGMVAAIMSMVYFVARAVGQLKSGDMLARDLTRISYGFIMAGLFLSLVGTILGGIWANYSWGRFWGWDPKENGALMIVLMNLVILHARLGAFIRELGFHACNIILGMIVIFSWFGTNQLGVGLHAYGFTDGIWFWLSMFWLSQCVFLLYAVILYFVDRAKRKSNKSLPPVMGETRNA